MPTLNLHQWVTSDFCSTTSSHQSLRNTSQCILSSEFHVTDDLMKISLSSSLMSGEKAAKQETGCWGSKACCEPIAWKDLALSIIAACFWIQDLMDQEVLLLVRDQKAPGEPSHAFCTSKHQCPSTECKYGRANTPPFSTCSQSHRDHRDVKWIQPRMKLLLFPFYSGPQWTFFPYAGQ